MVLLAVLQRHLLAKLREIKSNACNRHNKVISIVVCNNLHSRFKMCCVVNNYCIQDNITIFKKCEVLAVPELPTKKSLQVERLGPLFAIYLVFHFMTFVSKFREILRHPVQTKCQNIHNHYFCILIAKF